jgi:hypothetical protein
MKKRLAWMVPLGIVGVALFISLGGLVVMKLWNWLTPSLFGWHTLGFAQAVGLLALCRILVGGFGMHGGPRGHMRRHVFERWDSMSEQDRARFRHGMRGAAGCGPVSGDTPGQ